MSSHKIIKSDQAPKAIGPYNQATYYKGMLFVSGQIALDPLSGNLNNGDIEDELFQVMQNLKAVLREAGMTFRNVLKVTIFLSDMAHYARVNELYAEYFGSDAPARECVAVKGLPRDVNVEISLIAGE